MPGKYGQDNDIGDVLWLRWGEELGYHIMSLGDHEDCTIILAMWHQIWDAGAGEPGKATNKVEADSICGHIWANWRFSLATLPRIRILFRKVMEGRTCAIGRTAICSLLLFIFSCLAII